MLSLFDSLGNLGLESHVKLGLPKSTAQILSAQSCGLKTSFMKKEVMVFAEFKGREDPVVDPPTLRIPSPPAASSEEWEGQ